VWLLLTSNFSELLTSKPKSGSSCGPSLCTCTLSTLALLREKYTSLSRRKARAKDTQHHKILGSRGSREAVSCIRVLFAVVRTVRCLWLQGAATGGGIRNFFVLLPTTLWCWVSFARAFLLGRPVSSVFSQLTTQHFSFLVQGSARGS
jgi:hypothetical protein